MSCTYITFSTYKPPNFIPIHRDFSGLQAGCSTSMLFMLCAVQQYLLHIPYIYIDLFQCTFTRHTVDFSFPSPADAWVHPVPILNGLHGHTNTPSQHSYFLWPFSSTRQNGCKHIALSVKFSDIQFSVRWMPEEPVKRSSTVLVPIIVRAVGPHKQLYISQVSSGTHHVADNSSSPHSSHIVQITSSLVKLRTHDCH